MSGVLVYVHGGVSGLRQETRSLTHALESSVRAPSALDAVELAVRALEDDPALNAGYGAVLNRDGGIELDAGIADGATGDSGAVVGVNVRHPVSLARKVMHETPHLMITSVGAIELEADMDVLADTTPEQRKRWLVAHEQGALDLSGFGRAEHVDTVGAVALDERARLAAASSTGGVFGKMPGRVGDSPIFGAGFYASDQVAVVGTGVGELFLSTLACLRAGSLVEEGLDPTSACAEVVGDLPQPDLSAGLLALDRHGRAGAAYRGGSWSVEGPEGPLHALHLG